MLQLSGQYAFSAEAYPYRDLTGWHQHIMGIYGATRLMWASDFPWIQKDPGYGQLTNIIKELLPNLSDDEYDDIMGGTAARFFQFAD